VECRHCCLPRPKNFRVQKSAGKVLACLDFFWIKAAFSSLIIFQRATLWSRSITHLCRCNWRTFWRKNAAGSSPSWPCSCTKMPPLTGHLQPWRNCPTWASSILIIHPILRIWPRRTTTSSLDRKKKQLNFAIFRPVICFRGDHVGRTNFWFYLSGLQKLEQRAKKCIDFRGEDVEITPNLVAVACFLPGRANYFSATPCFNISTSSPLQLL